MTIARLFGTVWEHEGDAINYVFRWNRNLVEQTVRSYLLRADCRIEAIRLWDHNVMMRKLVSVVPFARARPRLARFGYRVLDTLAARMGNMMIAVVIKGTEADRAVESTLCEPR